MGKGSRRGWRHKMKNMSEDVEMIEAEGSQTNELRPRHAIDFIKE